MHRLVWKFWLGASCALLAMIAATALVMTQWHRFESYLSTQSHPQAVMSELAFSLSERLDQGLPVNELLLGNELSGFATSYLINAEGVDVLGRALPADVLNSQPLKAPGSSQQRTQRQPMRPLFAIAVNSAAEGPHFLIVHFEGSRNPAWHIFRQLGLPWLLAGSMLIAGLLALCLAYLVASPIRRLANRVTDGQLSTIDAEDALVLRRDEIGVLARALKGFSERTEQALRNERELLRDVSHEIRTPLARLQIAAERLELDAADKVAVEQIQIQVEEIDRLVDGLLYLFRTEAEQLLPFKPLCLQGSLEGAAGRASLLATQKAIRLKLEAPPIEIRGHEALLGRLLDNLLDNAIRYTPDGGEIALQARHHAGEVELTVQDSGPGIPSDHLKRIFEPFVRLDSARQRQTGGFGIGLAIVDKIARLHQARVQATNCTPSGLKVSVLFPQGAPPCAAS